MLSHGMRSSAPISGGPRGGAADDFVKILDEERSFI